MLETRSSHVLKMLELAKKLPTGPGCYFFKNTRGEIIYIGKATNLKNRVTSYFRAKVDREKTRVMVGHIRSLDFILTQSESESLILENNLIKKHRPKYNILLRDDKTYPYLLLNLAHEFPRLISTRKPKRNEHTMVFGPYTRVGSLNTLTRVLTKVLQLRDCTDSDFRTRKNPCLLYQLDQCKAPCVGNEASETYQQRIELLSSFVRTPSVDHALIQNLNTEMQHAAENELFERAVVLRDGISVLNKFCDGFENQSVELGELKFKDVDLIGFYFSQDEIDLSVYLVRNGILLGVKHFFFLNPFFGDNSTDESSIESKEEFFQVKRDLIFQYLASTQDPPACFLSDLPSQYSKEIVSAYKKITNKSLESRSKIPELKSLHIQANQHAQESHHLRVESSGGVGRGLGDLKSLLGLSETPRILECFDVAIWQGQAPTGAKILFKDGQPEREGYRHYHLTTLPEGNNDFQHMLELITRRVQAGNLPDLLILDGGKGQIGVVIDELKAKGVDVPVIGIAKSRLESGDFTRSELERGEERLIVPGRSRAVILKNYPELYRIVTHMRDEAHRFSRRLHHRKLKKDLLKTELETVPGISAKTSKELLQFVRGDLAKLLEFPREKFKESFGLNNSQLDALFDYLSKK